MKEEEALVQALRHLPGQEHAAWISEVQRLSQIVTQYLALSPKRTWQPATQQYEYVPAVLAFCQAARCCQPLILAREPHRAVAPSPHSLERWARAYRRVGAVALLRQRPAKSPAAEDARRAPLSAAAAQWLEAQWREIQSPRYLYREWGKVAAEQGWTIPSEAWLYRRWQQIPVVVKTVHTGAGKPGRRVMRPMCRAIIATCKPARFYVAIIASATCWSTMGATYTARG